MGQAALSSAAERQYRRNITRFYVYRLGADLALWSPIWVVYLQQERGLSLTQITAMDAPFWLVAVLAEIPTGTVADRWGRKVSLLLGAASFTVALLLFGLATNYPLLLAAYLAWPLSVALQSGADHAFLYDSLAMLGREREFPKILGRTQALHMVGFLLGGLIGAPLAAATSLAFPILASAAISLVAVLAALTFREPRHKDVRPHPAYFAIMREAARYTLHHPSLRWMMAVRAVLMGAALIAVIFTQPYLSSFDVPVKRFGLFTTPLLLLSIAGALLAHRLARRLGERPVLYMLAAGFACALLVLGVLPSITAFAMFGVLSFCNAVTSPVTSNYLNRHAPQHMRATLMSLGQMAFSVVLLTSEPLLGVVADRTSMQTMFLITGIATSALAVVALARWTAASRGERDVAAVGSRQPAVVGDTAQPIGTVPEAEGHR